MTDRLIPSGGVISHSLYHDCVDNQYFVNLWTETFMGVRGLSVMTYKEAESAIGELGLERHGNDVVFRHFTYRRKKKTHEVLPHDKSKSDSVIKTIEGCLSIYGLHSIDDQLSVIERDTETYDRSVLDGSYEVMKQRYMYVFDAIYGTLEAIGRERHNLLVSLDFSAESISVRLFSGNYDKEISDTTDRYTDIAARVCEECRLYSEAYVRKKKRVYTCFMEEVSQGGGYITGHNDYANFLLGESQKEGDWWRMYINNISTETFIKHLNDERMAYLYKDGAMVVSFRNFTLRWKDGVHTLIPSNRLRSFGVRDISSRRRGHPSVMTLKGLDKYADEFIVKSENIQNAIDSEYHGEFVAFVRQLKEDVFQQMYAELFAEGTVARVYYRSFDSMTLVYTKKYIDIDIHSWRDEWRAFFSTYRMSAIRSIKSYIVSL